MLLKGLVYQTMPQLTMVQAIAAEMRAKHKSNGPRLQDVREYLKTQIAIEKGNLKIGKLIIEEVGRQAACHDLRVQARLIPVSAISMNVRVARSREKGETLNLTEKRAEHLADEMFSPLLGQPLPGTSNRTVIRVEGGDNSPAFRMSVVRGSYYERCIAHLVKWTPTTLHYILAPAAGSKGVQDLVLTAVGRATVRGHAISFDRQACLFIVDGTTMTPAHVGARFLGWTLHEIVVPHEIRRLP